MRRPPRTETTANTIYDIITTPVPITTFGTGYLLRKRGDVPLDVKTWRDFPDFYNNPLIKRIADNQKWTVSDKDKRPIDMHALINNGKIWGMAFDRGYNPMVDLKTLCERLPTAANNAYYLDALEDHFVVLDIEPKCPDNIKQKLLELPYQFAETSMSGKGYHLLFDLPDMLIDKYPVVKEKLTLKEEHGNYEILLNHVVTFTRNALPPQEKAESWNAFLNVFELLATKAKSSSQTKTVDPVDIDIDEIPYSAQLLPALMAQRYGKTPADFYDDMSKYEFGMTGFYYRCLCKVLKDNKYKDHEYTDEEKAVIIYYLTSHHLPHREKHDQTRNNMPWLLYIAAQLIAKNE